MSERTTVVFDDDVWTAMSKIRGESLTKNGEDLPVTRLMNDLIRKQLGLKERR